MWLSTSFFLTNINIITCFFFLPGRELTWCYNALNCSWDVETVCSYMLWPCREIAIVIGRRWECAPFFYWRRLWLTIRVECFGPTGAFRMRTCRCTTRRQGNNGGRCRWCWRRFVTVVGGLLLHLHKSVHHTRRDSLSVSEGGRERVWVKTGKRRIGFPARWLPRAQCHNTNDWCSYFSAWSSHALPSSFMSSPMLTKRMSVLLSTV